MWVKICGVRDRETLDVAIASGATAIGLNFVAGSVRCITPETARSLVQHASHVASASSPVGTLGSSRASTVETVGLFVNRPVSDVIDIATATNLSSLQLHGDESAEDLFALQSRLPGRRLYRAFRLPATNAQDEGGALFGPLAQWLDDAKHRGVRLDGVLIDGWSSAGYGGTGTKAPWNLVRQYYQYGRWPPLILAGGLTGDNVAAAIADVQPWGVDVASGVESAPGVKDRALIQRFVQQALGANTRRRTDGQPST
jgi:phosphoribosylanthranilate isomerase